MRVGVLFTVGTSFFEKVREKLVEAKDQWEELLEISGEEPIALFQKLPRWFSALFPYPAEVVPEGAQKLLREFLEEYKQHEAREAKKREILTFSAELSTWKALKERYLRELGIKEIHVWLVPTRESRWIAKEILKPHLESESDIGKIRVEISKDLEGVDKPEHFRRSLDTLVQILWNFYRESAFDRVYLVVTGGYKGFIPLVSILGMMFPNTYLVYKHEKAEECVIYPPLPVVPDFPHLDALRTLLASEELKELDRDVYEGLQAVVPAVEGFFQPVRDSGRAERTELGRFFGDFYRDRRALYGKGEPILRMIQDEEIRGAIEEKLPYWEYLWIGDQIPETVEHSRRHALRLLEYTGYLLAFFPQLVQDLGDEGLAILYSSIWLHDFGHGALYLGATPGNTFPFSCLLPEHLGKISLGDERLIALNPDLIRKYHNLYTVVMLQEDFSFLLPEFKDKRLKQGILLASLYHRRAMPLSQGYEVKKPPEGKPLKEVLQEKFPDDPDFRFRKKVQLASALLSFVDGLDVQTDRVVGKEYREVRETRDRYEMEFHRRCLKVYNSFLPQGQKIYELLEKLSQAWERYPKDSGELQRIQDDLEKLIDAHWNECFGLIPDAAYHLRRILFISRQKEHFLKHSLIDMVYLTKRGERGLEVRLVESDISDLGEEEKREILQRVREDIYQEYEKGRTVLGEYFNLEDISICSFRTKN